MLEALWMESSSEEGLEESDSSSSLEFSGEKSVSLSSSSSSVFGSSFEESLKLR